MTNSKKLVALFSALALLTACGGGGGGGGTTLASPEPAASEPAPAASTVSPPVTSVAAPTYAAGSPQQLAFNELNTARSICGFGKLAQSAQLDQSATAHAAYQSTTGVQSHTETPGQLGFTGAQVWNRTTVAGFPGAVVGETVGSVLNPTTDSAADVVRNLMGAPYHQKDMLDGFRNVGFGWSPIASWPSLTVNLGTMSTEQAQAPSGVVTYPCAGITDALPATLGGERPSPLPNAPAGTVWGQPVVIRGPVSLRVTSASITGPRGSIAILAIYGDGQTTDPFNQYKSGWASIIPAQLNPNTGYNVAIDYTVNDVAGSVNFAFATGH